MLHIKLFLLPNLVENKWNMNTPWIYISLGTQDMYIYVYLNFNLPHKVVSLWKSLVPALRGIAAVYPTERSDTLPSINQGSLVLLQTFLFSSRAPLSRGRRSSKLPRNGDYAHTCTYSRTRLSRRKHVWEYVGYLCWYVNVVAFELLHATNYSRKDPPSTNSLGSHRPTL